MTVYECGAEKCDERLHIVVVATGLAFDRIAGGARDDSSRENAVVASPVLINAAIRTSWQQLLR